MGRTLFVMGKLEENRLISQRANYQETLNVSFGKYDAQELARIVTTQDSLRTFVVDYVRLCAPHFEREFIALSQRREELDSAAIDFSHEETRLLIRHKRESF